MDIARVVERVKRVLAEVRDLPSTPSVAITELEERDDEILVKGDYELFFERGKFEIVFDKNLNIKRVRIL